MNPANDVAYGYDVRGRLSQVSLASTSAAPFKRTDYAHDANGNRTSVERRVNAADGSAAESHSYTRTPGTNRIASIATPAVTRTLAYDTRGNLTTETRGAAVTATTAYDGHGRLISYARTGDPSFAHSYNGLGDRVTTATTPVGGGNPDTRTFVTAPDGRSIGEYGSNANDVRAEFIWLSPEVGDSTSFDGDDGIGGYMPLAVVTGTTLTYVHGDHLGTPIVMTDAAGTQVAQPAGYTTPAFPGQSRTLPDLYYNRYRDYDPTTGRYIQADPIGLEGGASPYSYAMGNPVRYVDPLGQAAFALPAIGGGAGIGGIGAFCASGPWGWAICGGAALGTGFLIWYNWPDEDDIVATERKFCPPMSMAGGGRRSGGARSIPAVVNNYGESDRCVDGWLQETQVYCPKNFTGDAYFGCLDRARDRLLACKREGRWPPRAPRRWTIFDARSLR